MTHIVQIAPFIGRGSGVAGVAWNLQTELVAMGHTVESFTVATAQRRPPRRWPRHPFLRAFALFRRMVWFTTVGTVRARRFLAERPDAVSICHNNVMAGDIYVNHGVVGAAMRARGNGLWRMVRNPTHIFTYVRDSIRYRSGLHRAVVALSQSEADTLRRVYGRVRSRIVVIPNGVDLTGFRPPTAEARRSARADFHLDDDQRVVLFIGHEFARKGLDQTIEALVHAPSVLLLVVGGNAQAIDAARARAEAWMSPTACSSSARGPTCPCSSPRPTSSCSPAPTRRMRSSSSKRWHPASLSSAPPSATHPRSSSTVRTGFSSHEMHARSARDSRSSRRPTYPSGGLSARRSVEHLGWRRIAERYLALVDEIIAERAAEGVEV